MGKRFKRRTKPIILIVLICFVSINVFPYDIIGIEKKSENIVEVLLTVNYGEKIDDYVDTEYRVLKSDEDSIIYLISIESSDEKTTVNDICKLLNIPSKNNIVVNYGTTKGEYIWKDSEISKKSDYKWVTSLLAIAGVCIVYNAYKTVDTYEEVNIVKNKVWFTLFSITYLLLSEATNIFIKNKLKEFSESSIDMFDKFQHGIEKSHKEYKNEYVKSIVLGVSEKAFLALYAYYYGMLNTIFLVIHDTTHKTTTTLDLAILITNGMINNLTDESFARYLLLQGIKDRDYKDIITVKGMIYESP